MKQIFHEKYGKGMAVIAGTRSGLQMTYAAYLAEIGYSTILMIANDAEKLAEYKQKLLKQHKGTQNLAVMWYEYDFSKANSDKEKQDLADYVTRVAKTTDNHCSVLVNNLAMPFQQDK